MIQLESKCSQKKNTEPKRKALVSNKIKVRLSGKSFLEREFLRSEWGLVNLNRQEVERGEPDSDTVIQTFVTLESCCCLEVEKRKAKQCCPELMAGKTALGLALNGGASPLIISLCQ